MPKYFYIATSNNGEQKKSQKQAKDKKELAKLLKKEGFFLISAQIAEDKKSKKTFSFRFKKVKLSEKLMATRNLQVMISAGVPLPRALETLLLQTNNKYFKEVLNGIKEKVIKGSSLSESFAQYPKVFPEIYSSMVEVGEKTGNMEDVLDILAIQLERSYKLKAKVKGAMIYPAVILSAMIIIGVIMLIKVVPQLNETFTELNLELPAITTFIVNLGLTLQNYWYIVLIVLIGIPFLFGYLMRKKSFKNHIDGLLLRIPFIKGLVRKINIAYGSMALSALIKGGVPIVSGLQISSGAVNNLKFKKALQYSSELVEKGEKMSQVFKDQSKLFPELFVQMIKVGEETGETSQMLLKLADFYEDQVANTTKNLSSIIEPILLLVIGATVGFFAIAMVQPIYSIMSGL